MNPQVRNLIILINAQSNEERMKSQKMELGRGGLSTIDPCSITEGSEESQVFMTNDELTEWNQDYYDSIKLI